MKKNSILSLMFVICVMLHSCNEKSTPAEALSDSAQVSNDSVNYTLEPAYEQSDSALVELYSTEEDWQQSSDTTGNRLLKRKGETWKMWRSMFQSCMANEWVNSPYYFGPTNTINLGSIVSGNYDRLIWELDDVLSADEMATVINSGNPTNCEQVRQIEMALESLMEAKVPKTGSGELALAINNAKKTTTSVDAFQVDNLKIGPFLNLMRNSPDTKKQSYLADLKKGNKVLAKVIKVSGFSSTIELNNKMSAGLKAELQQGKLVEFGDAGVKVNFAYVNDNTISVRSQAPFVVFAKFLKANKI
jgi:hypothetical protein